MCVQHATVKLSTFVRQKSFTCARYGSSRLRACTCAAPKYLDLSFVAVWLSVPRGGNAEEEWTVCVCGGGVYIAAGVAKGLKRGGPAFQEVERSGSGVKFSKVHECLYLYSLHTCIRARPDKGAQSRQQRFTTLNPKSLQGRNTQDIRHGETYAL